MTAGTLHVLRHTHATLALTKACRFTSSQRGSARPPGDAAPHLRAPAAAVRRSGGRAGCGSARHFGTDNQTLGDGAGAEAKFVRDPGEGLIDFGGSVVYLQAQSGEGVIMDGLVRLRHLYVERLKPLE
jgi:hypothetical protein